MQSSEILIPQRFIRILAVLRYYKYTIINESQIDYINNKIKSECLNNDVTDTSTSQFESVYINNKNMTIIHDYVNKLISGEKLNDITDNRNIDLANNFYETYKQHKIKKYDELCDGFNNTWEQVIKGYLVVINILIKFYRLAISEHLNSDSFSMTILSDETITKLYKDTSLFNLINRHNNFLDEEKTKYWFDSLCKDNILSQSDNNGKNLSKIIDIILSNKDICEYLSSQDIEFYFTKNIYKSLLNDHTPEIIQSIRENEYRFAHDYNKTYTSLVTTLCKKTDEIDKTLSNVVTNWDVSRISIIDKTIIGLALVEYKYLKMTPYIVAINEYIEIGKIFGSQKTGGFINGVIDSVYKQEK